MDNQDLSCRELVHRKERIFFILAIVVSIITYLSLIFSVIGIIFLSIGILFSLFLHALMLGSIRSNGVRLSPQQFPQIYSKVAELCKTMDIPIMPDIYVLESSGILNAFATRFFGRNMVVLYSTIFELIESGEEDELSFIIAHELAHIKRIQEIILFMGDDATNGLSLLYSLLLPIYWYGYTIGKRMFSIRIVKLNGEKIGIETMLMRILVASLIYIVTLGIGLIVSAFMMGFRKDKRAIHDLIAGTYVTYEKP
ncbi:Peptidase family M48 [Desulfonispora thiosulfatigenes DSM 11270]|uniref:Peptidase family M48 n=1 Tax=Desulfonispora thiosulfatigenes DSM 11270 TaxID=656914 RepID=A0A1W1VK54_DESTI|nr:RDD family protein [Desulfonispora thiosulfatigenes]SMB93696.1 Peptidase family M48 [Desulfonispora thiosulfatigenes DSM 11270]